MAKQKNTLFPIVAPADRPVPPRINQQKIQPSAIRGRHFGGVPLFSTDSATASATLANGDDAVLTVDTYTPNSDLNLPNLTNVDISFYAGTVAAANELPGGASVTESNWQVIGPINSWQQTQAQRKTTTLLYIRNISNGSTDININTRSRAVAKTDTS